MAVRRSKNWLGQQRVDTTHLREVESAVVGDFDDLAGKILASSRPIVVSGFTISMAAAVGNFATQLILNVANGILLHGTASEPGAVFVVSPEQGAETLSGSNTRVTGSFTPNAINYIGIDLVRAADAATADIVKFRSATTLKEFSQQVPLARTLQYRIVISTSDFAQLTNVAPVAKVQLDVNGIVTSVTDCREMMFRLGSGGSVPSALATFAWPGSRTENPVTSTDATDPFVGADKSIASFVDFFHAMESRLWEVGGGEHWYSQTTDRDVLFIRDTSSLFTSSSENFEWTGTNIHWKGLSFDFGNSTATRNVIADQTVDSAGLTDLAVGQCIYVDVNRASEGATLTAHKANLSNLGTPTIPGSRHIIAWRVTEGVYSLGQASPVGYSTIHATTALYGTVRLWNGSNHALGSIVPTIDSTYGSLVLPTRVASLNGALAPFVIGSGDGVPPMVFNHGRSDVANGGSVLYTSGALFEWQEKQSPGAGDNSLLTLTSAAAGAGAGVLRIVDPGAGAGALLSRLETMTVSNPYGNSAVPVTLTLKNNLAAGSALADVTVASSTTRVAGSLLRILNNASEKFRVDYDGLVTASGIASTAVRVNEAGIVATGNGTGAGVSGTGGPTDGAGVLGTGGTTNGIGVVGQGTGTGTGVSGTGGPGGGAAGVLGTGGGGSGGNGVKGVATGNGSGVWGDAGTGLGAGVVGDASGGSGPGGSFRSNATRGAINLLPQATPSTPVNGDIWVDTGDDTVKARVAGTTVQLSTTAAGTMVGAALIDGATGNVIGTALNVSSTNRIGTGRYEVTFAMTNWPSLDSNVVLGVTLASEIGVARAWFTAPGRMCTVEVFNLAGAFHDALFYITAFRTV